MGDDRPAPRYLVVVIRDATPLVLLDEPVEHRMVVIELTDEQAALLALQQTGQQGRTLLYESVSACWLQYESPLGQRLPGPADRLVMEDPCD